MRYSISVGLFVACALASACATVTTVRGPQPQSSVWVCHGGRNPKWHRVSANAASAHRRHGDRVSDTPQPDGQGCS